MLFRLNRETPSNKTLADQNAARRGDTRALERLLAAHSEQIYALSYWLLGEERAATEAARAAARLAAGHSATLPLEQFQLWLLRWVVLACQARWRPTGSEPRLTADRAEAGQALGLQSELCRLPLELRLALVLVDVAGLDYTQAATVLGAKREQVGGWVAEGRARLMGR